MADPYADFASPDPYAAFASPVATQSSPSSPTAASLAASGYGKQVPIGDQLKAVGTRADDLARQIASGVTLGGADRLAAAAGAATGIGGAQGDYSGNLAQQRAATEKSAQELGAPATLAANIGGNVLGAAALPAEALSLPASAMGKAGKLFGIGAGTGAVAGGLSSPDWANAPQTARDVAAGGAEGGTLGVALPAVAGMAGKVASPFVVTPEHQALVDTLRQAGINPTAGQVTGNKTLSKLEAAASDVPFGGGGADTVRDANNRAFTAALLQKSGVAGDLANPETLAAGKDALGARFGAIAERNQLYPDDRFAQDLAKAQADYEALVPPSARAPGVPGIIRDLTNPAPVTDNEEIPFELPAVKPPRPSGPLVPMLDVMRRYGLQDEGGDLASMGFADKNSRAPKGTLKVIDKINGVPMDEGLRIAQEQGYMEPHETLSDFIEKLGNHPTYKMADQREVADRTARNASDVGQGDVGNGANYVPPGDSDMFPGDTRFDARAPIAGDAYQAMRSRLTNQAQSLRFFDPPHAQAYRDVRDALDNAMDRSIAANNPSDAGEWARLRRQYGNYKAIEKAAGSAGAGAAEGIVSPAQMRTALASGKNRGSYARGEGDLTPLTNAGNAILTNFPQSGTTPRLLAAHMLGTAVPHAIGGGVGYYEGGLPGALAGAAVPALAARGLMSRPVQAMLANQLARRATSALPSSTAALAAALAGAGPQEMRTQNLPPR